MTNCGLWVNHKWVKSPLTPLTRTPVGWGASGTFLNGGAYALASKTRHYEISAQWMGTQAEIATIVDEIDTGEPIYLTDPFSYANILPHWLAKPQAMTKDAPYFTAVRPTLTGGNAVFTGTGTKTFTVSVPEPGGRFTWFGSGSGVTVNGVSVPAPATVEDARNLAPNPTAVAGGAGWVNDGTGGTVTLTGNGYELTRGSTGTFYAADNGLTAGTVGAHYSMRVKVTALTANLVGKPIYLALNNGSTFLAGSPTVPVGVYPPLGQSVTITLPATLAAGTTGLIRPYLYQIGGAVAGDKVLLNEIDIRRVGGAGQSVSGGFFTGNTPDTETYQYAWAGTPNSSASIRYRTDPTVVSVPAGPCTIGLTGSGSRTVNGMVLSVGQEPIKGTPGQGYTQVQCTGVTVTGYSAPSAIDRVGLSATFVEVGGWR